MSHRPRVTQPELAIALCVSPCSDPAPSLASALPEGGRPPPNTPTIPPVLAPKHPYKTPSSRPQTPLQYPHFSPPNTPTIPPLLAPKHPYKTPHFSPPNTPTKSPVLAPNARFGGESCPLCPGPFGEVNACHKWSEGSRNGGYRGSGMRHQLYWRRQTAARPPQKLTTAPSPRFQPQICVPGVRRRTQWLGVGRTTRQKRDKHAPFAATLWHTPLTWALTITRQAQTIADGRWENR